MDKDRLNYVSVMKRVRIFVFLLLLVSNINDVLGLSQYFINKVHGFVEVAFSRRLGDIYTKHYEYNLGEVRLQLKTKLFPTVPGFLYDWAAEFNFKSDFLWDLYFGGKTEFLLREFNLTLTPWDNWDIKLGRQIFTWGTGDYLFINDVFPKDYISFFIGRDDEYLKAPSWGIKASYFGDYAWLDLVLIPYFEPNITVKGDRLSFYDPLLGKQAGRDSDWIKKEPVHQLKNTQLAARLYSQRESWEWALYFYRGFYTNPQGYKDPLHFEVYYPLLNVYGASLRGPLFKGITNLEFGYYDSRQDRSGKERNIPNPEVKFIIGYTRDFKKDFSLGGQYYVRRILKYSEYIKSLSSQDTPQDKVRSLFTIRINKKFKEQTVVLSNFLFFSPSDREIYFRSVVSYKVNDKVEWFIGSNWFWGDDDYTEFGQMEGNSNIYFRLRYSF